jgi:tripartite-type tricarboxylate transporter receptor subunit TctC
VPTLKEAGYNLDAYAWYCVVAPVGTPAATVDKLNKTINEIVDSPQFAAKATQLGVVRRTGTPQDLGRYIQAEYDKWAPLITELGLAKTF